MKTPTEPASWSKMRKANTYRSWLRNNAKVWYGVMPDRVERHPPLIKEVSDRGEVHYKTAKA